MNRLTVFGAAAIALGLSFSAIPASASDRDGRLPSREQIELTQAPVNAAAALAAAQAAGLGTIRSVEWEHGAWQVKAIGSDGRRVEVYVDAQTGAITPRRR